MFEVILPGNEELLVKRARDMGWKDVVVIGKDAVIARPDQVKNALRRFKYVFVRGASREAVQHGVVVFGFGEFDHVVSRIAKEKGAIFAFAFSEFLESKKKALLLRDWSRAKRLCDKYGVKTMIASFASRPEDIRSPFDLASFLKKL